MTYRELVRQIMLMNDLDGEAKVRVADFDGWYIIVPINNMIYGLNEMGAKYEGNLG